MDRSFVVLQLIISYSLSVSSTQPWPSSHPALRHHELLHVSDLRHRVLATVSLSQEPWTRQIHFYCLGRSFGLHLESRSNLFSSEFKVHLVNESGHHQPFALKRNRYYRGYLIGDNSSDVVVTMLNESTGMIMGQIITQNEAYYIEPAHFHLMADVNDHKMVVYRRSDAVQRYHLTKSIDYVTAPDHQPALNGGGGVETVTDRSRDEATILRRQAPTKDTCSMVVVADYTFFQFLRSSESNVIDTIVSRIDATDRMSFRTAKWIVNANGNTITGRGLQIDTIIIHTEPSSDDSHYNSADSELTIQDLLRRFSRNNWSDYCLAHLMTHRTFPSRKLGLAYIASPAVDETGGICSTRVLDAASRDIVTYNTGVSIVSAGDRLLLPSEAELVIAHELGHSWGSSHDPGDDSRCAEDYLMNEFAQDGSNPKHREFSPCSLKSIGRVLNSKSSCFKAKSTSLCGNFIVDDGEECDEGTLGGIQAEGRVSCCTTECRLSEGSVCSDVNDPCCLNCSIASVGSKVCHVVGNVSRDCTSLTTCDGVSKDCPDPNQAEVNSRCTDGICMFKEDSNSSVECVPFCEIEGLETCLCEGDNECLECCVTENGECQPLLFRNELVSFPDGVFCSRGFCSNGICEDSVQDFASQLWSVITALDINEYAQFVRENIVGFVLLIVTMIWIPGSCLFHYMCDVKKVWKRCFRKRSTESPDMKTGPAFVTQTSWTQVKRPDLTPLLSVQDDESPVDEPEDDLPLPAGFTNYSSYSRDPQYNL